MYPVWRGAAGGNGRLARVRVGAGPVQTATGRSSRLAAGPLRPLAVRWQVPSPGRLAGSRSSSSPRLASSSIVMALTVVGTVAGALAAAGMARD